NAMRRELIDIGQNITDSAFTEDLDNPVASQIEMAEKKLYDLSANTETRESSDLGHALKSALAQAEIAYKAGGGLSGLTTGFRDLDKSLSGLHGKELIIIAGRPGMGKTTFALNLAFNAANAILNKTANDGFKGGVAFFSLEMAAAQLASKVLSDQADIPGKAMRDGNLNDVDFTKMAQYTDALSRVPLFIDDTPGLSVPMLRTRMRRLSRKNGGLALVVVDYLQLMQVPGGGRRNDNRVNELTEMTRGLKMLAMEMNVPIIVLSQLSRAVESRDDKRPMLSDLRESGSIEQDADVVMFTYRDEYYLENRNPNETVGSAFKTQNSRSEDRSENFEKRLAESRNKAEIIIGKNRHGRTGKVHLMYFGDYSRFKDDNTWVKPMPEDIPPADAPTYVSQQTPNVEDLPDMDA
ncbi:MAG: replicative DNA helicase, partial [Alphaproteobacteria bacterium]|nr:replicative DNA helicase [Alphaproteobacteria bacterium]